jgi:hypothetical protein
LAIIHQCIIEDDYENVFVNQDYSISTQTKFISTKKGTFQASSKPVPVEIQEHTAQVLEKMVLKLPKHPSSVSSSATTSTMSSTAHHSTLTTTQDRSCSTSYHASSQSSSSAHEERFCAIEQKLDSSSARMDSIEDLCRQLKTSTDCISGQLNQLLNDVYVPRHDNLAFPAG